MRKLLLILLAALLAGCASAPTPVDSTPRVTIVTTGGTLTARLLPAEAPQTVSQFLRLVDARVFDSVYFYRVEKNFVAQTAMAEDREVPMTDAQRATIKQIPLEASAVRHTRGVLSLAHGDDPNSGETSFSILLAEAPHLDGKYTVFGVLEDSDEALRAIEATYNQQARDASGRRLQVITITAHPRASTARRDR